MGMPTVAPLINENVYDELEVITELDSAEPKPGNAASPAVSDEVEVRPVYNH